MPLDLAFQSTYRASLKPLKSDPLISGRLYLQLDDYPLKKKLLISIVQLQAFLTANTLSEFCVKIFFPMQVPMYGILSNGLSYIFYRHVPGSSEIEESSRVKVNLFKGATSQEALVAMLPVVRIISQVLQGSQTALEQFWQKSGSPSKLGTFQEFKIGYSALHSNQNMLRLALAMIY